MLLTAHGGISDGAVIGILVVAAIIATVRHNTTVRCSNCGVERKRYEFRGGCPRCTTSARPR